MGLGRTVLLGDATFVPRPHTAGGTAKAVANAVALAATLRGATDISVALAQSETTPMHEGLAITTYGIRLSNQAMHIAPSTAAPLAIF